LKDTAEIVSIVSQNDHRN